MSVDKQPSSGGKPTRPVATQARVEGARRPPPSAVDGRMRSMLILGGAFVVLAGLAAYLLNTPAAPVATTTPVPTVVVWDYNSATVSGMTVQNMTATLTLAVQDGKWRITAPIPAEADDLTVSGVATTLKQPAATTKVGDTVTDLAPTAWIARR